MLSPDGSEFGIVKNQGGTWSINYDNSNGDGIIFNVSSTGQLSSLDHATAKPASDWSIHLADGTSVESPYSDLTPVFTGTDGTQYIEYTDVSGAPTGEDWTIPGSSHGYVTVGSDGSTSAVTYNIDGTYYTVTSDGAGNSTTEYFSTDGTLTADTWTASDSSYGSDQYNADGSSSGTYYSANGNYVSYTDDGKGNISEYDYSSIGTLLSSEWQNSDGSYGDEVVNTDGSIDGTEYQANGSYATFAIDLQGDNLTSDFAADDSLLGQVWSFTDGSANTITYDFDPSGNLLQGSWKSADGASGAITGVSGVGLESALSADRIDGETISAPLDGGVTQALGDHDSIYAAAGSNVMYALGREDYLQGSNGNDTLIALGQNATLAGGSGSEVYVVNDPTDVVQAQPGAVSNQIDSSVSYALPVNVEVLTLTGSSDLVAEGNTDTGNLITGSSGNDTLIAGSGADTLVAGSGDDNFVINNSDDVIEVGSTPGNDVVESSVSYTLRQGVDTLELTGSANLEGQGNADLFNTLEANDGNDTLIAGSGFDTLIGGSGADTFVAGAGFDTFVAGSGNDTFIINKTADVIDLGGASGSDSVESSVSYTLGLGIDTLELTGTANLEGQGNSDASNLLQANSGSDTLVAGSGDDTLVAGSGMDVLEGGAGSTTYVFGSGFGQTEIEPGSGSGVIQFGDGISPTDITASLTTDSQGNLALLIQDGPGSVTVDGGVTGSINSFEFSGQGPLSLEGFLAEVGTVSGTISGSTGSGILDSSSNSSLLGGYGDDTLIGTGASDTILAGAGNQQVIGAGEGDILAGGAGDDTLYGGVGEDTLIAGTGNTVMYGGSGTDTVVLTRGATSTFYPGAAPGGELVQLPVGMTLGDFQPLLNASGDLILQSLTGDTTAVIKGYSASTDGKTWVISDSTGASELLKEWLVGELQSPSGYTAEMDYLRQEFSANLSETLNQMGQQGGTIEDPGRLASGPYINYHFNGVATESDTVQGGVIELPSSEGDQATFTVLSEPLTYTVETPQYGLETEPGSSFFVPSSDPNADTEAHAFPGSDVSFGAVGPGGQQGYEVTTAPLPWGGVVGTSIQSITVPAGTYYTDENQSITAYNVTGDGGNDSIMSNGNFVGTVVTGNGNVNVDFGLNDVDVGSFGHPSFDGYPLPPGAFIEAGTGNDNIEGTGGADVIAAGTGFDNIFAAQGATVYVPLEGTSTEHITIQGYYYAFLGGPLPQSTLVLPDGITPQDLSYRVITGVNEPNAYLDGSSMTTPGEELQIAYGGSTVLLDFGFNGRSAFASSTDDLDGIDRFQFSDGTVLTRDQVIALAGPAVPESDFNPVVTALNPTVTANSTIAGATLFSGSDTSGSSITWYRISNSGAGGGSFVLDGTVQAPEQTFYVSSAQLPELEYIAGAAGDADAIQVSAFDGVEWGTATLFNVEATSSGDQATGPNQEVTGSATGPDTLVGGYGGDTLVGSSGQDTFVYSAGSGAEVISETAPVSPASEDVVQFGSGISPSSISLSESGDPQLVFTMGSGGDSLTIDGFDPLNPLQSFPIQSFAFADGTTLSLSQLLADSDVIGSSGSITNADGSLTSYEFTPSGQQIYHAQATDSAGQETHSVQLNADGSGESDTFNVQGQRTDVDYTHANGSTDDYRYTFNANGTLSGTTEVSTPAGGGGVTTTVSSYDGSGNEVSQQVTNPDGSEEFDTYNTQGQQTGVDYTHADGSTDDYAYTFNANGTLSSTTEVSTPTGGGGSTTTVYGYDGSGNEVSKQVTYPDGSGELDSYNAEGQRLSVNYTRTDGSSNDWTYTYSADGTLSGATEVTNPAGGGAATTFVYSYDAHGNQVSENDYTPGTDGSYVDNWTKADGSHGSYWWNASTSEYKETWYDSDGSNWTDDYQFSSGGSPATTGYSYLETYSGSDGSQGTRQFDASTGSVSLTWYSAATGSLSGTISDSGFIGLQNDGELTNSQQDLTFFNPSVSPGFNAFLAAH